MNRRCAGLVDSVIRAGLFGSASMAPIFVTLSIYTSETKLLLHLLPIPVPPKRGGTRMLVAGQR